MSKTTLITGILSILLVMPALLITPCHSKDNDKPSIENNEAEEQRVDDKSDPKEEKKNYQSNSIDEDDLKERIMAAIPYSEDLEYMWNVVDGDVDVYFTGLRVHKNSKGFRYTTNHMPFIGPVDGLEMQFTAGEDMKFTFKSDRMPIIGKLEGLNYKGSMNNGNAEISARYTIALD